MKKPVRKSLLEDDDMAFVSDDDDTIESDGDICGRRACGRQRSQHDEATGECPDRKGTFRAGA
jgi:hypothetical protein